MNGVKFFDAVDCSYLNGFNAKSLITYVDSYFCLNGRKACVISGHSQRGSEGVIYKTQAPRFISNALKVASYATVILPLIFLAAKTVLRSCYRFHVIDIGKVVEEGIEIPEGTVEKINQLQKKIFARESNAEITHYPSNNYVFQIPSLPHLIFKARGKEAIRFENIKKAHEVRMAHNLDLLQIPFAQKLDTDLGPVVVEEYVDVEHNPSMQEKMYAEAGSSLEETARQIAAFIAETGFSDIEWRNLLLYDSFYNSGKSRLVRLVDLEEMENAPKGIYGGAWRRGLINCLFTEKQIDIVLAEANRRGVPPRSTLPPAEVKESRLREIREYNRLQEFYRTNRMLDNPRKPLEVDLNSLGVDLGESHVKRTRNEVEESITFGKAVARVVKIINEQLAQAPPEASVKKQRTILLSKENKHISRFDRFGFPRGRMENEETRKLIWLQRIIKALVDNGHLFKLEYVDGYGYHVQA